MPTLQLRLLLIALIAYSRWPAPARARAWAAGDPAELARARAWLPAVGLLVAVPAAVAYAFAALWLPHAVAVLVAMLVALVLGGAVHERELARWMDEAEASSPGRVGALAAVAVAMLVLARLETLSTIDPTWIAVTLACAAAFSRGCALLVAASLPQREFQGPGAAGMAWALGWAVAPSAAAAAWTRDPAIFATAAALGLLAGAVMRRLIRRRVRAGARVRTDAIGAVQTIVELAYYVGVLATLSIADAGGDEA